MSITADLAIQCFHQRPVAEGKISPGIDPDCVATLAHEIRNILSLLGSSLELLNWVRVDETSASQARGIIAANCDNSNVWLMTCSTPTASNTNRSPAIKLLQS
jgi:hypothetical protein